MYKAVIIEDEQKLSEALSLMLQLAVPGKVEVAGSAAQVASAIQLINTVQPHVVFMDIQLKDGTAFNVLDQITYKEFHLIFTTAYQQHAILAFKYSAIDYLLKPVDTEDLIKVVSRIEQLDNRPVIAAQLQQLQHNLDHTPDSISLPTHSHIYLVPLADIVRCETSGSYTTFHLINGEKIIVSRPLKSYDELLLPPRFFRIHQSHTVNLNFVRSYAKEGFIILDDNIQLPVAQRKKEAFLKLISRQ